MDRWHINEELFQAVFRKDIYEAAGILKQGSHVNARSINGHSVIHCAVMNNDLRMVRLLTKTPLHTAAKCSCEAVTKILMLEAIGVLYSIQLVH